MGRTSNTKKVQNGTRIMRCECHSTYQDEEYGEHKRVYNGALGDSWVCSVCGRRIDPTTLAVESTSKAKPGKKQKVKAKDRNTSDKKTKDRNDGKTKVVKI